MILARDCNDLLLELDVTCSRLHDLWLELIDNLYDIARSMVGVKRDMYEIA